MAVSKQWIEIEITYARIGVCVSEKYISTCENSATLSSMALNTKPRKLWNRKLGTKTTIDFTVAFQAIDEMLSAGRIDTLKLNGLVLSRESLNPKPKYKCRHHVDRATEYNFHRSEHYICRSSIWWCIQVIDTPSSIIWYCHDDEEIEKCIDNHPNARDFVSTQRLQHDPNHSLIHLAEDEVIDSKRLF